MKILFAASECVPFCKTGGLADVIGALPKELRKRRHDVRIILPKYKTIRSQEFNIKETGETIRVPLGDRWEEGDIRSTRTEKGIRVYFVNQERLYGRPGLYRTPTGDFPDNDERFIFFSRAVLEACKAMEFRPDIIHCHDWQTGLLPVYLKQARAVDAFFQHTASVFTIHNIAYQGLFPPETLEVAGLPREDFTWDKLEYYGHVSFLKAGLVYANALTTVSPTYSQEIQSSAVYGRGMEGVLRVRAKELTGILNGLDTEEWNPAKDPFLPKPFDVNTLEARKDCKASLQKTLKLPVSGQTPLVAMVARLDPQKGLDLLIEAIPGLMRRGVQLVILGQGDPLIQEKLVLFQKRYPEAFRVGTDFNDPLAHHIYAGCDLFLMPSRFEPCGLGQMIAMRYGAVPVVSCTGGLRDTVIPVGSKETGTGFMFYEMAAPALLAAIDQALLLYRSPADWGRLQKRCMGCDFSWQSSSEVYLDVYRRALGRRPSRRPVRRASPLPPGAEE